MVATPEGEIKDMFVVTARAYLDASVADIEQTMEFAKLYGGEQTPEQYEAWEDARAETARIACPSGCWLRNRQFLNRQHLGCAWLA